MKPAAILSVAAILFAGCVYEAPLVAEHTIPIDPALVGLWEPVPEEPKAPVEEGGHPLGKFLNYPPDDAQLLILKFSETEYVVTLPAKDGIHYRAYVIELGGKRCMQLQVIGTSEGPPDWDDGKPSPFLVCSFEIKGGNLLVRTLNPELVDGDLKTTEALQAAFLKNKDNAELFGEPTVYRKVKAE